MEWWSKIRETKTSNGIVAICTIVIAIATIAYFIVSYFQWQAALESNKINRESLQSVQRPFLLFEGIEGGIVTTHTASSEHEDLRLHAKILNAGNTTANELSRNLFGGSLANEPTERQFKGDGRTPIIKGVLGPKAFHFTGDVVVPSAFFGLDKARTTRPVQPIRSERGFYLWGWVVYRDVFPGTKVHVTEFCQILTTITQKELSSASFEFTDCKQHNCADGECDDYKELVEMGTAAQPN
jgi:hypothetical protein